MGKKQTKNTEQQQQSTHTQSSDSTKPDLDSAEPLADVQGQAVDEQQDIEDHSGDESESDLQDQVHELTQQLTEANEKFVRMAAEHDNYRKRMNGELERARKYEVANFAREMLEVLESLDRACEITVDDDALTTLDSMREGVDLTRKQLIDGLGKFSIEQIDPQPGEEFDVNFHQAMTMHPTCEIPANHVVETFRKGYKIHDRLLRPAMVVVACEPETKNDVDNNLDES